MPFRIVILEGPRRGEEFLIKDTIAIGRKKGDLQLNDPKASTLHAKITCENGGMMEITDLDSSNGTYVNGERVKRKRLVVGDTIVIGKTTLRVEALVNKDGPVDAQLGAWQGQVDEALSQLLSKLEKISRPTIKAVPFTPPIELEFVAGIQSGQKIVFGFGPRQVGSFCNDALLHEVGLPPVAFELRPVDGALCEFKTKDDAVLVNGQPLKASKLKNGDRISVGRTLIIVREYLA